MEKNKILIAGSSGMVGSSILRRLNKNKNNFIFAPPSKELDFRDQIKTLDYFKKNKFKYVFLAAAKVGGIYANNCYPANFIYNNLMIESNVIHSAFLTNVKRLLFFGSSCIYPKNITRAMKENDLLSSYLEPTNEPYAIAKIAGIKLCESYNRQYKTDFRSVMPTNLYGPGDHYDEYNSHIIPALIKKFHFAKINNKNTVVVWGSGNPRREFLYVEDLTDAALKVMNLSKKRYMNLTSERCSHINIGYGSDIKIKDLANLISKIVGFRGEVIFDLNYNDGTKRKLINSSIISSIGWKPKHSLEDGLIKTYENYKKL